MKLLRIYNKGLLNINEIRLMGCSSKTGLDTFGRYGTGLKYAIAVLIRENIKFDIYLGKRKVTFQTDNITIRNNVFKKIIIDFESTSITTNLGVEWNTGQALREFIANAKDMGGGFEKVNDFDLHDGETTIIFQLDEVEEYLSDFDFEGWTEVTDGYFFKKLEEKRRAKVFKEGFLVYEASDNSSYDYRIDDLTINESRVAEDRQEVKRGISRIQRYMNKEDVEVIVNNKETNLGIFYDFDSLGDGWDNVNKKDIGKNDGYELRKLVDKNIKEKSGEDRVDLVYNSWTYVNHDNEIGNGIYLLDEGLAENLWDIDLNTLNIYIAKQEPDSHYLGSLHGSNTIDYSEIIREAKSFRKAAEYVKKNKLTTAIDTAQHFLEKNNLITGVCTGLGDISISNTDTVTISTSNNI